MSSEHVSHNDQAHFDKLSQEYDTIPGLVELTTEIANAILSSYPFDGTTEVMDFACGTGLISKHLAPRSQSVTGVDTSQGMIDQFNGRGIPNLKGIRVELGVDKDVVLGPFDVITASLAYHHMDNIASTTTMLVDLLKPSGVLFVADLIENEKSPHANDLDVPHRYGFSTEHIQDTLRQAGLHDVSIIRTGITTPDGKLKGGEVNVFLARGTK